MVDFLRLIPASTRTHLRATALPQLTVIAAQGADAVSFLHSQLTQDVQGLTEAQARLAGYCTAKGRLLATMVIWQAQDGAEYPEVRMLVHADLAQALIKRLSMFVLRAKVRLLVAPLAVSGLNISVAHVDDINQALGAALPKEPWQRAHSAHGDWITVPCADPERLRGWWVTDAATQVALDEACASDPAAWDAEDIAAGLPWIGAATQDLFIPQTLNLDLIGGVNFGKGCYPGQEVVARSHYRGVVKRRMAGGVVTQADRVALPGVDVFQGARPDQPCGRIIAAATVGGATRVLFEAPFEAVDADDLRVGAADGPTLKNVALPYATRE